jgi:hypothetical protein
MNRTVRVVTILSVIMLMVCSAALAQSHTAHPPPPHVSRYKKKDTVRVDLYAVDTLIHPIPIKRALFHDKIDNEQKKADAADGRADKKIKVPHDSLMTEAMTYAFMYDVDRLQTMIENMPANGRDEVMDNQQKIRCLQAVWEMLRLYNNDPKPDLDLYVELADNMDSMIIASNENKMMDFVVANTDIYTLDNGKVLLDNQPAARAYLYTEMGKKYPVMMVHRLDEFAKDTFAGNIIKAAARLVPDLILNYATSTNYPLKTAVYSTQDELVQCIVKIAAHSKAPQKALPFLADLYYRRKTVDDIDTMVAQPDLCFEELVRLRLSDDTVARRIYMEELNYRALNVYVRPMNKLHEEKDDVRFKCIDSLPASSLYFILISGQDEIYTSSFLGTFKRLMDRMKPLKGDQLLDTVHRDHFRTFIRMCAGYNTLSDYLATIDDTTKNNLMSSFISGLEHGKNDDLEGAVDVADAFGSIRDSALSAFLETKVKENYELSYKEHSKKGLIVYSLLARLFESNNISGSDTGAIVASSRLKLAPINKVLYKDLVNNDSGVVYQQVFFFGDKDGQDSYDSYMGQFKKDPNWAVVDSQYWTQISSTTGKKVVIYANLPLKEPDDEDAQNRLSKFLSDSGIHPTVIIHRGHSYHLPMTLARLNEGVKIVILGSCGGYHNLASVLERAPDAHIISSKQTGAHAVNEPIIKALNDRLLNGADVNWIAMWHELEDYFKNKPDAQKLFDDYVPPYKNLGAIFIKAYKKMMGDQATPSTTANESH